MITTVTLNAAIDKTYEISSFQTYQVNRTDEVFAEPGGKAINVAKVLKALGTSVMVSGIVGGFNGKQICTMLDGIDLQHDFVRTAGESRICLNVVESSGKHTEILESGPEIQERDWKAMKEKFEQLTAKSEVVVLSGSLPRGLAKSAYADLIRSAQPNCRVLLDTSGAALSEAMVAKPFMIKPNEQEFADLLGRQVVDEKDMVEALLRWDCYKIPVIVLTLGKRGALALVRGKIYRVIPPTISAVNPVGSGDAFTAGMAFGFEQGWSIEETLKLAAAAGTANALEKRAGIIKQSNLERFKDRVLIENI